MEHPVTTREATLDERAEVIRWFVRSWGAATIAVHGELYDVAELAALVALDRGRIVGVLTYAVTDSEWEIVSCDADPPGRGVGSALVEHARASAAQRGVRRMWCTTTNDNLPALGFWQARGFTLVELRPGAVARARLVKPSIPFTGHRGLSIRDELDLEVDLAPPATRPDAP